MDDPAQRRLRRPDAIEDRGQAGPVGDIPAINPDLCARRFELGNPRRTARRFQPAAAEQRDRAGAVRGQPARRFPAEPIDPAGDQIGPVAARGVFRRFAHRRADIGVGAEDELADMTRRLHQAKGVVDLGKAKQPMRQRPDRAGGEQGGDFAQQGAGQRRPAQRQLVDIDREIRKVLAQRAQMEAAVEVEIALAEFEKAPERFEHFEAAFHRLAAQRVQHDVDPLPAGDLAHPIGKAEIARIEHMVGAGQPQKRPLGRRPGGGDDDGAAMPGVLDRGQADAAGRRMDQDMFPGGELRQVAQRIDRGDEGDRQCRRGGEAHFRRDRDDRVGRGYDPRAQRRRGKGHDPVADRQARHRRSDGAHDAGAFEPERRTGKAVDQRLFRQQPHRPHHIAEVEGGGVHIDLDLARPDRLRRARLPAQRGEAAGGAARQGQRLRWRGPARRQTGPQPQHMAPMRGPDDLGFRRTSRQFVGDLAGMLAGAGGAGRDRQAEPTAAAIRWRARGRGPKGRRRPARPRRCRASPAGRRR